MSRFDNSNLEVMCKAVNAWLNFQIYCGRKTLLSEDYLSQPLAEFLLPHYPERVEAEWTIPQLKKKARGRPKQIDFVLRTRDADHPEKAIEAKWVSANGVAKQELVDDVLRLEMLRVEDGKGKVRYTQRLFLLAGETIPINRALTSKVRSGGDHLFFPLFLPNDSTEKVIDVMGSAEPIRPFFKSFAISYGVELPKKYKTQLLYSVESGQVTVLLWTIKSTPKRSKFDAPSVWATTEVPLESDDDDV